MRIAEYRVLGLLPLQDHRDLKPEERISLRAGRIEARDDFGSFTIEGHGESTSEIQTYGDVQGGFHIPARSPANREMGSWFFASYGVSTSDYKAKKPDDPNRTRTRGGSARSAVGGLGIPGAPSGIGLPFTGLGIPGAAGGISLSLGFGIPGAAGGIGLPLTSLGIQGASGGRTGGSTSGSASGRAGDSQGLVGFVPVGDPRWKGDNRYAGGVAAVHPDITDFPKGTPVLILSTTQEKEQNLLAMPLTSSKLICPNFAGDAELGTYVYDLTKEDKPDLARRAQLQSFWRVIRLAGGCSTNQNNTLAWQLSQSGNIGDPAPGLDGRGMVVDWAGPPSSGAKQPPPKPEQPVAQGETEEFQVGSVTLVSDILSQQADRIRRARAGDSEAVPGADTGSPGIGGGGFPILNPLEDPLVVASVTARAGGFIEVGDVQDPHRIGQTLDGQAVNCAHLSPNALWKNDIGDGPMDFETVAYEPPTLGGPFLTPVHFRWDEGDVHDWTCGQAPGKWRWEAESFFTIPETWVPSRRPPYTDPRTQPPRTPEVEDPEGPVVRPGTGETGKPITNPKDCQTTPGADGDYQRPGFGLVTPGGQLIESGVRALRGLLHLGGGTGNRALTTSSPTAAGSAGTVRDSTVGGVDGYSGVFGIPAAPSPLEGSIFTPISPYTVETPEPKRAKQKESTDETGRSIGSGVPGQAVQSVLGVNLVPSGTLNLFGAGVISGATLRALQASRVLDDFGRPRAIPPPQVGDGRITVRQRNGGLDERVPTMVQTTCMGGGLRFGAYATANGQTDLTGGGWIREQVALIADSAPVGAITAFGNTNGTGSWDDLQAPEGVRSIAGGLVMGGPEVTSPENLRSLLDGNFHPDQNDVLPGAGRVPFYVPGGLSSMFFGHPSDGRNQTVGSGSTELDQTSGGLRMQPFDSSGAPTSTRYSVTAAAFIADSGARVDLNSPNGLETLGMGGLDAGGILIARTGGTAPPKVNMLGDVETFGTSDNGGNLTSPALCVKRTLEEDTTVPADQTMLSRNLVIPLGKTLTLTLGGELLLL